MSKEDRANVAARLATQSLALLDYVLTQPQEQQILNGLAVNLHSSPDIGQFMAYLDSEKGQVHLQTMHDEIERLLQDWDPT